LGGDLLRRRRHTGRRRDVVSRGAVTALSAVAIPAGPPSKKLASVAAHRFLCVFVVVMRVFWPGEQRRVAAGRAGHRAGPGWCKPRSVSGAGDEPPFAHG
jgi:hypothetical protein